MSPGPTTEPSRAVAGPGWWSDLDADLERTPFTGAPDPEFDAALGAGGRARRGADPRVHRPGRRRIGPEDLHDRAHRGDHDRAVEAKLRAGRARAPAGAVRRARALGLDHQRLPLGAGRGAGAGVRGLDRVRAHRRLHLRPRARGGQVLRRARRRRWRRCASTSTAASSTRTTTAGCRSSRCRGTARRASSSRSRTGARRSTRSTRTAPGSRWTRRPSSGSRRLKAERGLPTFERGGRRLARRGRTMRAELEGLVSSLLVEGYALYPYTPGATKNATPTPFGIVYPPAYAEGLETTFDHLRLECVLEAEPETALTAAVRFLQPSGEGHRAVERRLELGPAEARRARRGRRRTRVRARGRGNAQRPPADARRGARAGGPVADPGLRPQHHRRRRRRRPR